MSIQKVIPNLLKRTESFTVVINSTLDLIPEPLAFAIYVYLAGKPCDWVIREQDLMRRFNKGRDSVVKALKLLKTIGLLSVKAHRNSSGQIESWHTTLLNQITENQYSSDEPAPTLASHQNTEKPESGESRIWLNQNLVNQTHTKERELQKKDKLQIKETKAIALSISLENLLLNNPFNIPEQMIKDWLVNRKAKRAPVTETVWIRLHKQLKLCPNPVEAFGEMVERGWQTVKPGWIAEKKAKGDLFVTDSSQSTWLYKNKGLI